MKKVLFAMLLTTSLFAQSAPAPVLQAPTRQQREGQFVNQAISQQLGQGVIFQAQVEAKEQIIRELEQKIAALEAEAKACKAGVKDKHSGESSH